MHLAENPDTQDVVKDAFTKNIICFSWSRASRDADYLVRSYSPEIGDSLRIDVVRRYNKCCIGNLEPATLYTIEVQAFNLVADPYNSVTAATSKCSNC